MTIAPWLQRHLENTGRWNTDGITRTARIRRHPCGTYVAVGLDSDRAACAVTTDLDALTPLGEALALLGNRRTYRLRDTARLTINHRMALEIRRTPADQAVIVAAHTCHAPPLPSRPHPFARPTAHTLPPDAPAPF